MKRGVLLCLAALAIVVPGELPLYASPHEGGTIRAFVSIEPQAYLVERICGDSADVRVLVGAGQDPHTYEPTPAQMSALARSDVYFTIGVPFEAALLPRINSLFPNLRIADTLVGVKPLYFTPDHGGTAHESHHGNSRGSQAPDPHTWLDPKRAKVMSENIASFLKTVDPARAGIFERNLSALLKDLDDIDAEIARILEPLKERKIYVFHPAFGYFCESYGLKQEAFEIEGKEPSARQLAGLIESARKEGVRAVFVQPQFSKKAARAIADSIGGVVVPVNPLPRDYLLELKTLAEKVRLAHPVPGSATDSGKEAVDNAR